MDTSNTLPTLLDERAAASRLGLSPRTLQAWRVSGGGPVYRKVGRRVLYAVPDLAAFLDAGTRSHTSEGAR